MLRMATVLFLLIAGSAQAAQQAIAFDQWAVQADKTLYDLIQAGGEIVSSNAMQWPDGHSAQLIYVQKDQEVYRCIDWFSQDLKPSGTTCAALTARK